MTEIVADVARPQMPHGPVKTFSEVVGVFDSPDALQAAIDELVSSGFSRAALSLLASERALGANLAHRHQAPNEVADDPATPRAAYVSPEAIGDAQGGLIGGLVYVGSVAAAGAILASGGTLAAAIAAGALAGGAGGLIGGTLAGRLGRARARHIEEQLASGGLLLWVQTRDVGHEMRAIVILKRHSGRDVHVHALLPAA